MVKNNKHKTLILAVILLSLSCMSFAYAEPLSIDLKVNGKDSFNESPPYGESHVWEVTWVTTGEVASCNAWGPLILATDGIDAWSYKFQQSYAAAISGTIDLSAVVVDVEGNSKEYVKGNIELGVECQGTPNSTGGVPISRDKVLIPFINLEKHDAEALEAAEEEYPGCELFENQNHDDKDYLVCVQPQMSAELKVNGKDIFDTSGNIDAKLPYGEANTMHVTWTTTGNISSCSTWGSLVPTTDNEGIWTNITLEPSGSINLSTVIVDENGTIINYANGKIELGIQCWGKSLNIMGRFPDTSDSVIVPFTDLAEVARRNAEVDKREREEMEQLYPPCNYTENPNSDGRDYIICAEGEWLGTSLQVITLKPDYVILHTEFQFENFTTGNLMEGDSFRTYEPRGRNVYNITVEDIDTDSTSGKSMVKISILKIEPKFFERVFNWFKNIFRGPAPEAVELSHPRPPPPPPLP